MHVSPGMRVIQRNNVTQASSAAERRASDLSTRKVNIALAPLLMAAALLRAVVAARHAGEPAPFQSKQL